MTGVAIPAYEIHNHDLSSQELFELVAARDYDGLSTLFARVAMHCVRHHAMAHRARAEEKMDDGAFWNSRRGSSSGAAEQSAMYNQLLRELSLFVMEKEEAHNTMEAPLKKKTKLEVSADAEQLLRDAVAAFADSRPPTNFVVYEDLSEEDGDQQLTEGPPIFDGSVANATPQTGGAGTILHLACALDEPLCLAFGLAMGADARACHTAFRRLMIHEAACNGSIQCLTLLLELGKQYGETRADNDADAKLPPRLSRHSRTFELPFLPRRMDRNDILAPFHLYAMQGAPAAINTAPLQTERMQESQNSSVSSPRQHRRSGSGSGGFLGKKKQSPNNTTTKKSEAQSDFLILLQQFRLYARQVKMGDLSEIDAARKVLELATLTESSKVSIGRSCAFPKSKKSPEMVLRSRVRHGGTSDGHGNTPLHWAAFKNEVECVSLLLDYGANPNARAHPSGWTPLHDAAYSNSKDAVELLIQAGAEVDARANSGATPLCFASQEDAADAARILLDHGADLSARCAGGPARDDQVAASRFSGYTPLHYCSHYNAEKAAGILLRHRDAKVAMEVPDLNDRLPIHVAVARGSSGVLRELLHAGARVVTRQNDADIVSETASTTSFGVSGTSSATPVISLTDPSTPRQRINSTESNVVVVSTPVSSPVLRSMIPSQPVTSAKPWNCLTQKSIDECRALIHQAELSWSPERHQLFSPHDRKAVMAIMMAGRRLEQDKGVFLDLWPQVLSFCGRGWFDPADGLTPTVVLPDTTTPDEGASVNVYYNCIQTHEDQPFVDDSLSLPNL